MAGLAHQATLASRIRLRTELLRAISDAGEGAGLSRKKILIVEDNALLAINIEDWLTEGGYEVVGIAASAEEAMALAAQHRPALAIMDIRLAGARDGIDTAADLLQAHGIRSVFASAHSEPDMKARAETARPAGWLTKPYSMSELLKSVTAALGPKPS